MAPWRRRQGAEAVIIRLIAASRSIAIDECEQALRDWPSLKSESERPS